MNGEYLLYLQEIKNTEWVIELISEQFDDAMNMMTRNSVIYGGAVRDCLAGKELIGDLDIAVSTSECTSMVNKFIKNPKWVNVSGKHDGVQYKKFGSMPALFSEPPRRSPAPRTPQIMTFKTLGNKTVQIIILPTTSDGSFQTVTTMVKQVDIVCCGVILTSDNKVFEVVPNAYNDCKKHVLHLNNACYVKDIDNFKKRIEKLSERGWINEININKAIRAVNRRRKQTIEHKKVMAGLTKRHPLTGLESHTHNVDKNNFVNSMDKNAITENGYIVLRNPYTAEEGATGAEIKYSYATDGIDTLSHTGYRFMLYSSDIGHIGGLSDALYTLESVAKKYRLDMIVQPIKNCLAIVVKNRYISNQIYERVMGKGKRFNVISSKKLEAADLIYTTSPNPPIKKKYKLNIPDSTDMVFGQLDAQTAKTPERGSALKPSIASARASAKINKQMLNGLNAKKEPSEGGVIRTERYFNYSTERNSDVIMATTDKHYQGISRGEITRTGGVAMMLTRLERIARRDKLDIGVIMSEGSATIITRDQHTSSYIYDLLSRHKNKLSKATWGENEPLKDSAKSSGGTIRWK